MITAKIEGDEAVVAVFREMGPEFTRAAKKGLQRAALAVQASAADDFIRHQGEAYEHTFKSGKRKGETITRYAALGPPVEGILTSRTGVLRSSISIADEGELAVAIGPTVVYGAIHEFGGDIPQGAWSRLASTRLVGPVFKIGKERFRTVQDVKAHEVSAHTIHMPARPYLRPALAKQRGRIIEIIQEALANAVAKVIRTTGAMRVKT
jgi:phage gpG-like protein